MLLTNFLLEDARNSQNWYLYGCSIAHLRKKRPIASWGRTIGITRIRGVGEAPGFTYLLLEQPGWLDGTSAHAMPHILHRQRAILPLLSFLYCSLSQ